MTYYCKGCGEEVQLKIQHKTTSNIHLSFIYECVKCNKSKDVTNLMPKNDDWFTIDKKLAIKLSRKFKIQNIINESLL